MKAKDLIEYLQGYPEDEEIVFITVDVQNRMKYENEALGISDAPRPVIAIEIGDGKSFDEEENELADRAEAEEYDEEETADTRREHSL